MNSEQTEIWIWPHTSVWTWPRPTMWRLKDLSQYHSTRPRTLRLWPINYNVFPDLFLFGFQVLYVLVQYLFSRPTVHHHWTPNVNSYTSYIQQRLPTVPQGKQTGYSSLTISHISALKKIFLPQKKTISKIKLTLESLTAKDFYKSTKNSNCVHLSNHLWANKQWMLRQHLLSPLTCCWCRWSIDTASYCLWKH